MRDLVGRSVLAAFLGAIAAIVTTTPAAAKDTYKVKRLVYENHGEYVALLGMKFKTADTGAVIDVTDTKTVSYGETIRWRIDPSDVSGWNGGKIVKIDPGDEVWLYFEIVLGDPKESCRKKKRFKLIYDEDGGTAKFNSKGTTLLTNRCRLESLPDDKFKVGS